MWARNISDKQSGDFVSLAAVLGSFYLKASINTVAQKYVLPEIYLSIFHPWLYLSPITGGGFTKISVIPHVGLNFFTELKCYSCPSVFYVKGHTHIW